MRRILGLAAVVAVAALFATNGTNTAHAYSDAIFINLTSDWPSPSTPALVTEVGGTSYGGNTYYPWLSNESGTTGGATSVYPGGTFTDGGAAVTGLTVNFSASLAGDGFVSGWTGPGGPGTLTEQGFSGLQTDGDPSSSTLTMTIAGINSNFANYDIQFYAINSNVSGSPAWSTLLTGQTSDSQAFTIGKLNSSIESEFFAFEILSNDSPPPPSVPEPSSIALLGLGGGLGLIAYAVRRRKQRNLQV